MSSGWKPPIPVATLRGKTSASWFSLSHHQVVWDFFSSHKPNFDLFPIGEFPKSFHKYSPFLSNHRIF